MIAHINMSWVTWVYRDDLVTFQVDGTHGSAVAGLTDRVIQARQATRVRCGILDERRTDDFYADWQRFAEERRSRRGSRSSGRRSIRHVREERPKTRRWKAREGAQLADARRRVGASGAGPTLPRSRPRGPTMNKPVLADVIAVR